jgi:hypothetical protein
MKQIAVQRRETGNQYYSVMQTIGFTVVDDKHFWELNQYIWTLNSSGYVVRYENKKVILMHTDIWERLEKRLPTELDHTDRDKLNNQLSNFRSTDRSLNNANKVLQANSTTGFKGVNWHKRNRKYQAYITVNRKYIHLGSFNTAIEAAKAYDQAAVEYFEEFACTNKSLGLY